MSDYFKTTRFTPVDGNGNVLAGAKLYTWVAGTTDQLTTYTDTGQLTAHPWPVVADADGVFPAFYIDADTYKYALHDADDVLIYGDDNVPTSASGSGGISGGGKPVMPTSTLTNATVLTVNDYGTTKILDATGGDFTVTLPPAPDNDGGLIAFEKSSVGGRVTLVGASSQTINGASSLVITNKGDFAITTSNGANHTARHVNQGPASIELEDLAASVTGYLRPVGEIIIWPRLSTPAGYLPCDGRSLLRSDYQTLFDEIGTEYGAVDSDHFSLPDYRALFLRGYNGARADAYADPDIGLRGGGNVVGTLQQHQIGAHAHSTNIALPQFGTVGSSSFLASNVSGGVATSTTGGNETRPNNIYVHYLIFASPEEAAGASGTLNRIITVSATPGPSDGVDGDYAIDNSSVPFTMYGPKASGAWPAGYPLGLNPRGAWLTATGYAVADTVSNNGSSYICISPHTSGADSDEPGVGANTATYWMVLAAKGDTGAAGAAGANGTNGADGPAGPSQGISCTFSNVTTSGDPGAGVLRLNNATVASVTEIYVDDLDRNGTDVSTRLDRLGASTSTIKASIEIRDPAASSTNYAYFDVTAVADSTGYRTLTVQSGVGAGTLPDGAEVTLFGIPTGDAGSGAVATVFGRSGNVVAAASDYDASQIDNDSDKSGSTVADALDDIEPYTLVAVIEDQKSSGTNGGTFTSGADRTRDLNTLKIDNGGVVTIASNQFTILGGANADDYLIRARVPASYVNAHQAILYDVTNTADVTRGSSGYAAVTSYQNVLSELIAEVTLSANTAYEIRHRCATTQATYGFGSATSLGTEVYTVVEIYKKNG